MFFNIFGRLEVIFYPHKPLENVTNQGGTTAMGLTTSATSWGMLQEGLYIEMLPVALVP